MAGPETADAGVFGPDPGPFLVVIRGGSANPPVLPHVRSRPPRPPIRYPFGPGPNRLLTCAPTT